MNPSTIVSAAGGVVHPLSWRGSDGLPLDFAELPPFDATTIDSGDFSLWRYAAMLPVEKRVTLGEGMTPLVRASVGGATFYAKLEYLNPTGSYKDRGTVTMMNHIAAHDVDEVVEDSSGNAGASVSAYASALGITPRIYVPATASETKKSLIRSLGGVLVEIEGPQHAKTEACQKAAETVTYASHAWSPFFLLGQMTAAWEVWEQLGRRAPDAIVTPLGHGGLFLGFARGFRALLRAGLIDRMPRLFGVQAANSDPLVRGFESGDDEPPRIETKPTVADGIIVDVPVRGREVLAALRATHGGAFRVEDDAILRARDTLYRHGFTVEPTSAVTYAALPQIQAELGDTATVVLALTGNGLKYL